MLSECSGWEVMCVMSLITGGATYYEKSIYLVLLPLLLLAVSHVLFLYNTRSIPPWYIIFSLWWLLLYQRTYILILRKTFVIVRL